MPPPRSIRLSVVVNNLTPYRVQSHLRFKREIPGLRLDTYVTWDTSRNLWVYKDMPDIGVVTFPGAITESMIGTLDYYAGDFRTGGKVIRQLEANPPDAVLLCGYGYPAMYRVLRWCTRRKVPCILWTDSNVHSDTARGIRKLVKRHIVSRVVRDVSAIFACGHNGARYWANYGATADRMFFGPVEPDYDLIEHAPPQAVAEVVRAFNLKPDRRRLLVCSRLVPVKAVDQAIDAFAGVARKRPDVDLVILGNGPLRSELTARVPSPLASRVIFAGFQDRQEIVNAWYSQSHVLLHPATWEPWGVVLLEAAAAGLAIITTHVVGAVPEVAHDGVNAVLVRPNDRRALMHAIMTVTEPGRLEAMRAASVQVSQHFRAERDPVEGLRKALAFVGLPPDQPAAS
ncbi:MAG: hypothetical protein HBSAPP03_09590 [Phycisphaerae bacterium]|nr:MAG: hypothetical protein HBSAPP03_09590 [Phycisphaerae bacterium]